MRHRKLSFLVNSEFPLSPQFSLSYFSLCFFFFPVNPLHDYVSILVITHRWRGTLKAPNNPYRKLGNNHAASKITRGHSDYEISAYKGSVVENKRTSPKGSPEQMPRQQTRNKRGVSRVGEDRGVFKAWELWWLIREGCACLGAKTDVSTTTTTSSWISFHHGGREIRSLVFRSDLITSRLGFSAP